jgi:hypothetical protein
MNRYLKQIQLIIFTVVLDFLSFSQKEIVSQSNAWTMYFGNHRITEKIGIHSEYQWRRSDFFESWQQSLMRLGVDYYAKNGLQFTAGYGWIKTYPYGQQPIAKTYDEHRVWQQLILKNKNGRIEFQHRYRLEQRFVENWIINSSDNYTLDGFNFRQRIRYRFMLNLPISKKEMIDNTLFLSLYDEVFIGFGKGIGKNVLDQNRLCATLGWRFSKDFNIQLGYLNQYVIKTDGIKQERNHTLQIGMTYNLDFRTHLK